MISFDQWNKTLKYISDESAKHNFSYEPYEMYDGKKGFYFCLLDYNGDLFRTGCCSGVYDSFLEYKNSIDTFVIQFC